MKLYAILSVVVVVVVLLLCTGCTTAPPTNTTPTATPTTPAGNQTTCTQDAECVPAQCCHPTSCTVAADAPNCSGVACTLSCEGPIDCGAGHCGCVNGTCMVIPGQGNISQK